MANSTLTIGSTAAGNVGTSGQVLTSNGAGTLPTFQNASGAGSKQIYQIVTTSSATTASTSTTIPADTSVPQNTEGAELVTLAITPSNASSTLIIEFFCPLVGNASGVQNTFALFQDTTANALNALTTFTDSVGRSSNVAFRHVMTAGTTSSTTFKIRFGPNSSTMHVLRTQDGGTTFAGTTAKYTLSITEVLP